MLKRIFLKVHVTLKDPNYNLDIKLKKIVPNLDIVSVVYLQFSTPKGSKSFPTCSYMYKRFLYVLNFLKAITLVTD